MTTTSLPAFIPYGFDAHTIKVEASSSNGLPGFNLIGLTSRSVDESRERIRSALQNSGFSFPRQRLTVNLAPANLHKNGTQLDLTIALAILSLSNQLAVSLLDNSCFVGELALDGQIRAVEGLINLIEAAAKAHFSRIFIPEANQEQAHLVKHLPIQIIPVSNLKSLWLILQTITPAPSLPDVVKNNYTETNELETPTFDTIYGQEQAKRALTIAIAGRHHLLMHGEPGSGKTTLALAAATLQPPLNPDESVELTKLHNLQRVVTPIYKRPFRAPHHSTSARALLGGGPKLQPGDITLAHHGILFLDELPEFRRDALEALRQPLESHSITLSNIHGRLTYPADFQLIAAMNPCPCGNLNSRDHNCKCTPRQIALYQNRISGPLLDRISLHVYVSRQHNSVIVKNTTFSNQQHAYAKAQIISAIARQTARFGLSTKFNNDMSAAFCRQHLRLSRGAQHLLDQAEQKFKLSTRSFLNTLRVAQTIADLAASDTIEQTHLAEALQYRPLTS